MELSEMIEEIKEISPISIPEAYKLLKELREKIMARDKSVNPIIERTLEYLSKLAKCEPDAAVKARRRLIEEGFDARTAAILVSIYPESIHEARVLLDFEKRLVETGELEKALSILREECGEPARKLEEEKE